MVDNQAPVALQCGPYVKVKVFVEGGEGVALRRTRVVCVGGGGGIVVDNRNC